MKTESQTTTWEGGLRFELHKNEIRLLLKELEDIRKDERGLKKMKASWILEQIYVESRAYCSKLGWSEPYVASQEASKGKRGSEAKQP